MVPAFAVAFAVAFAFVVAVVLAAAAAVVPFSFPWTWLLLPAVVACVAVAVAVAVASVVLLRRARTPGGSPRSAGATVFYSDRQSNASLRQILMDPSDYRPDSDRPSSKYRVTSRPRRHFLKITGPLPTRTQILRHLPPPLHPRVFGKKDDSDIQTKTPKGRIKEEGTMRRKIKKKKTGPNNTADQRSSIE